MAPGQMMDGSVFEGLFVRELKPAGVFKEELKRIGFDVERLEPRYPEELFRKAIELAATHAYPGRPAAEAHFKLGERLIAGYFSTILGRVTGGIIPVIGVKRTLKRVAQLWQVPMPGMKISSTETPDGWLVDFDNAAMSPALVAGIIEAALRKADEGVKCTVLRDANFSGQVSVRLGTS